MTWQHVEPCRSSPSFVAFDSDADHPVTMASVESSDEAAAARKKRKAILVQRQEEFSSEKQAANVLESLSASVSSVASSNEDEGNESGDNNKDDKKGRPAMKKTQIRYDPAVPMGKTELANWRREHRRVRNRESAAASRQRIRNRISELEGEVEQWKSKYNLALQRLNSLQNAAVPGNQPVSESK